MTIPIHKISIKMIHHDYPHRYNDGIFYFKGIDPIALIMSCDVNSNAMHEDLLTESIQVQCSSLINIKSNQAAQIGHAIYKNHIKSLNDMIDIIILSGKPFSKAVDIIFDKYNFDYDDIDFDTLYKSYTRKIKSLKESTKTAIKKPSFVYADNIHHNPLQIASKIIATDIDRFMYHRFRPQDRIINGLIYYIEYNINKLSQKQISRQYKTTQSSVSRLITSFTRHHSDLIAMM